jgi:hypothetical protein
MTLDKASNARGQMDDWIVIHLAQKEIEHANDRRNLQL